jgi:putative ABC transport system permease protein
VTYGSLVAEPLKEDLVAATRGTLRLLAVAVALVLVVACLNVANLLIVRATSRVREFAIRSALGSGGARIARQLMVECIVLAAIGGVAGLVLAGAALRGLQALGRDAISGLGAVELDATVLGVTAGITLLAAFVFGLAPALRLARVQPADALHQQSRSATSPRSHGRLRTGLAAGQLALALTLLAGCGALLLSFQRLQQVDFGFRLDDIVTFEMTLPAARYDSTRRALFQEELARRLEGIQGVTAAGATSRLPATGTYHPWFARPLTGPLAGSDFATSAQQRVVSGDFFDALEIPLLAGRVFDERDDESAPKRAVVSLDFAQRAFPGLPLESVPGQRIRIPGEDREVIGVVGDVVLDARGTPAPGIYHAHLQFADNRNWALTGIVASSLPSDQVLTAVRAELAALDPDLVVYRAAPLAEVVGRGIARESFALVLMTAFAGVALLLATVGLYGVLAYTVRQRAHEIGIRMVLGATAANIRKLVLRQGVSVVVLGVAFGVGGAFASGRLLSALLYETAPTDPRVLIATVLPLCAAALLAVWLPARRASRVEPRVAMQDS